MAALPLDLYVEDDYWKQRMLPNPERRITELEAVLEEARTRLDRVEGELIEVYRYLRTYAPEHLTLFKLKQGG